MLPDHSRNEAARALADAPHLRNLRRLELSCQRPGDEVLQVLLASPHLAGLMELHFDYDIDGHGFSPRMLRRVGDRFGATKTASYAILFRRAE
jgi:hypothetical protein